MSEHAVHYYQTCTCQTQTKFLRLNSSGLSLSKTSTHKPTRVKPAVIHIMTHMTASLTCHPEKEFVHKHKSLKREIDVYLVVRTVLSKKATMVASG